MENLTWEEIESFIVNTLSSVSSKLPSDAVDAINHYLYHGEYEMAFEILFIEIMELKDKPAVNLAESLNIGRFLNLDNDSVADGEFWVKFEKWISNI